jgi:hypothetical protein
MSAYFGGAFTGGVVPALAAAADGKVIAGFGMLALVIEQID